MAANLSVLAGQTERALQSVWNDLGVSSEERSAYIARIAEDVAGLYRSRVESQEQRKRDTEAEIEGLQTTIENMQHAMLEDSGIVSCMREWVICYSQFRLSTSDAVQPTVTTLISFSVVQPEKNTTTLLEYRELLDTYRSQLQQVCIRL